MRQLLSCPALQQARCVGGDALDRLVHRVTVRSRIDVSSLSQGDLVMVTEIGDIAGWEVEAGIRRCALAGVSGLVLPGGERKPLVTSVLLAERLGLPLILLPADANPHEAALLVAQLVAIPKVLRAEHVLRFLRRVSGRGSLDGLEAVAKAVATVLQAPVSTLSPDGGLVHGEHAPASFRRDLTLPQVVDEADRTYVIQPVTAGSAPLWLAAALVHPAPGVINIARDVLAVAEPWALSWLTRQRLAAERDARARTTLLADLLRLREDAGSAVRQRAAILGWRLDGWHTGIYLRRLDEQPGDNLADRDEMAGALERAGMGGPLVEQSDSWVAWHTAKDEPSPRAVRTMMDALGRALKQVRPGMELAAGVGRCHSGIGGLGRTVDEAREAALSIEPTVSGSGSDLGARVTHIEALGVGRLVRAWTRSRPAQAMATTLLAPMAGQETLLATLDAYLGHQSSVVATAAALGLHRNTVADRISRAQGMLGVDLRDPDDRLAVELACRTMRPAVFRRGNRPPQPTSG